MSENVSAELKMFLLSLKIAVGFLEAWNWQTSYLEPKNGYTCIKMFFIFIPGNDGKTVTTTTKTTHFTTSSGNK